MEVIRPPVDNRRMRVTSMEASRMGRSYALPSVLSPNRSAILSERYANSDSMLRRTQRPATQAPSRPSAIDTSAHPRRGTPHRLDGIRGDGSIRKRTAQLDVAEPPHVLRAGRRMHLFDPGEPPGSDARNRGHRNLNFQTRMQGGAPPRPMRTRCSGEVICTRFCAVWKKAHTSSTEAVTVISDRKENGLIGTRHPRPKPPSAGPVWPRSESQGIGCSQQKRSGPCCSDGPDRC